MAYTNGVESPSNVSMNFGAYKTTIICLNPIIYVASDRLMCRNVNFII